MTVTIVKNVNGRYLAKADGYTIVAGCSSIDEAIKMVHIHYGRDVVFTVEE